jgi:hypothetical protein
MKNNEQGVPYNCYQCGRPPMYDLEIEGKKVSLCLDCNFKKEELRRMQNEERQRMINYLSDQMCDAAGTPRMGARFPERTIIHKGGAILNNINIHSSQIGVVNTGYVNTIDAAVTTIQNNGNNDLSSALKQLTEAVVNDSKLSEDHRKFVLELLSTISTEASAPEASRKKSVIRCLIGEIGKLLKGTGAAIAIYDKVIHILQSLC